MDHIDSKSNLPQQQVIAKDNINDLVKEEESGGVRREDLCTKFRVQLSY